MDNEKINLNKISTSLKDVRDDMRAERPKPVQNETEEKKIIRIPLDEKEFEELMKNSHVGPGLFGKVYKDEAGNVYIEKQTLKEWEEGNDFFSSIKESDQYKKH